MNPPADSAGGVTYNPDGSIASFSWRNTDAYEELQFCEFGGACWSLAGADVTASELNLAPGDHLFTLRGRVGDAYSSLVSTSVTICDESFDLGDLPAFSGCLLGPGGGVEPGCECFGADGNGDVDLRDFASLQVLFTGD